MEIDEIRKRTPGVGWALYALDPFGPVTLEAHLPDGRVLTWKGWTASEALQAAFPAPAQPEEEDVFG